MKSTFLFFFFVSFSLLIYAQRDNQMQSIGKISGKITDHYTSQPIEYANVALYKVKDSSLVNGCISDSTGRFKMENLSFGRYYLKISFIGFKEKIVNDVMLNPKKTEFELNNLSLEAESEMLNEAVVEGDRKLMTFQLDKKIVNVEKNLVSVGGSAVDVLRNVPAVTVDIDNNLSLRGSSNVTILIDGRPSSLSGSSRSAILEQIPASSIETIEIITNPSAKYSPDGMSGIINIKLKRKRSAGLNGLIQMNYGAFDKYNPSINLNYNLGRFNLLLSNDYRNDKRWGKGDIKRRYTGDSTSMNQISNQDRYKQSNNTKVGLEWRPDDKHTFNAGIMYSLSEDEDDERNTADYFDKIGALLYMQNRNGIETETENSLDYTFNTKRTFDKKDMELTLDAVYSVSDWVEGSDISNSFFAADRISPLDTGTTFERTNSLGANESGSLQVNYTYPIRPGSKIEVGYNGIYRKMDNDYTYSEKDPVTGIFVNDMFLSNHFIYKEFVHAGYATYGLTMGNFGMQLGLRAEQYTTDANQVSGDSHLKQDIFSVYPTLHLSYKLNKSNELQLSYSRRVNRPGMQMLNPFMDVTNPQAVRHGNPNLKPEYIDSYEIGHIYFNDKISINNNFFYRYVHDVLRRYSYLDTLTNIAHFTYNNFSSAISWGYELNLDYELFRWWRISGGGSFSNTKINASNVEAGLNSENYAWTAKLNSMIILPKRIMLQLSSNYMSPIVMPQGKFQGFNAVDAALRKDFLKDKLFLSLRVSDIFNTMQMKVSMYATGIETDVVRKRESRVVYLNIGYKINGGVKGKQKKQGGENMGGDGGDF